MNKMVLDENDFIDLEDKEIFEEYLKDPSMLLMEMASVRGKDVKIPHPLPFSFHFLSKEAVHQRHGIRVKIQWIDNRINSKNADGYFEAHGNYEYVSGSHKYKPSTKELEEARNFIKNYKVLFAAAWEGKIDNSDVEDFFKGRISFEDLKSSFYNITEKQYYELNHAKTLKELEQKVRDTKAFNMND